MNIAGMQVYYASDLKDYGSTEDGERFIGYIYFVEVENARGDRWRHRVAYPGVKTEQWEEGIAYLDARPAAVAACELLIARVKAAGKIDSQHWYAARSAYGSEAYLEYGQADDLALERMEG